MTPTAELIVIDAAMLLFGIGMLLVGLKGRRLPSAPRCRRCRYNVTGVESGQCPECGKQLSCETIVHWVRVRRWVPLVAGMALLVATGAMLASFGVALGKYGFWPHAPMWAVARVADWGHDAAFGELERRCYYSTPSDDDARQFATVALGRQAADPRPDDERWLGMLSKAFVRNQLDTEQHGRFLHQLVRVSLRARPTIRQGESVPARIEMSLRPADQGIGAKVELVEHRLGGTVASLMGGPTEPRWPLDDIEFRLDASRLPAGTSVCETRLRVTITHPQVLAFCGVPGPTPKVRTLAVMERQLSATITVLPAAAPDPVRRNRDVDLGRRLREMVAECRLVFDGQATPAGALIRVSLCIQGDIPNVAFEVFLQHDDGYEARPGIFFSHLAAAHEGGCISWEGAGRAGKLLRGDRVRVILRSSTEAARRTVDLFEIWDGEFEIGPVQIE